MTNDLGLDGTNEAVRRWVGRYLAERERRRAALVRTGAAWFSARRMECLAAARDHHIMVLRYLARARQANDAARSAVEQKEEATCSDAS